MIYMFQFQNYNYIYFVKHTVKMSRWYNDTDIVRDKRALKHLKY